MLALVPDDGKAFCTRSEWFVNLYIYIYLYICSRITTIEAQRDTKKNRKSKGIETDFECSDCPSDLFVQIWNSNYQKHCLQVAASISFHCKSSNLCELASTRHFKKPSKRSMLHWTGAGSLQEGQNKRKQARKERR